MVAVQDLHGSPRRVGVSLLVVLAVLSTVVATIGIWAQRNVTDTERFVQRVGPLAQTPEVQAVLAAKLTDDLMDLVDADAFFTNALPERGKVLAAPLARTVQGYVHDQVLAFMETERFHELWRQASTTAHRGAVRLLDGQSATITAGDDRVAINLLPIIDAALARLGDESPQLLGTSIDLPTLTTEDLPDAARARIQRALGRPVGATFGEVTVYDQGRLAAAQTGVHRFEQLRVTSIVIALVSIPLALWLSSRRRRTLLQMITGIALLLIIVRRVTLTAQAQVVGLAENAAGRAALDVTTAVFVDPLVDSIRWIVGGLIVAMVVVFLTGPHRWAVGVRRRSAELGQALVGGDGPVSTWVGAHQKEAQIGGAALAALVLWRFSMSFWTLLIVAMLLAIYEVALRRTAGPRPDRAQS